MTWPQEIDRMELSNGRSMTLCALHQLVTCGKCCLDFSLNNSDDEHTADEDLGVAPNVVIEIPEKTKHSGTVFPSRFGQRKRKLMSLVEFFPASSCVRVRPNVKRFMNRYDSFECPIYTDGACFDNGAADARSCCGIFFKLTYFSDQSGSVAFTLEDRDPDGKVYRHTSNRAELRAVIAALRYRVWQSEGFRNVVIATDSTYVVHGATVWAPAWIRKGWHLSTGEPVKNRDLWESLLLEAEKLHDSGMTMHFWRIPQEWNHEADSAAKDAAENDPPVDKFVHAIGIGTRFM
ncbi:Putative ribonuclease H domain-containing protein [Colletotrichum destructivum]|uniref:ribonuclease H n=1 Tax=Colletotrichum destructivum TaxID=34406 RepID=A0AAX4HY05_9PEZI|nr:Putative ribonuclease H domain-containing protein [Colletotrichum destructivum]